MYNRIDNYTALTNAGVGAFVKAVGVQVCGKDANTQVEWVRTYDIVLRIAYVGKYIVLFDADWLESVDGVQANKALMTDLGIASQGDFLSKLYCNAYLSTQDDALLFPLLAYADTVVDYTSRVRFELII